MTFVAGVVASIVCMAWCLRVRGAAHSGGARQARQSRHAASQIDRRGSARVRRATAVEHRRARSPPAQWSSCGGHHLHSGADVVRHPNERSPDRTRLAVDEEPEDSSRSRHRPRGAERRPAFGSFEEVSSGYGRLSPAGAPPIWVSGRRASPSIAHREGAIWQRLCGW